MERNYHGRIVKAEATEINPTLTVTKMVNQKQCSISIGKDLALFNDILKDIKNIGVVAPTIFPFNSPSQFCYKPNVSQRMIVEYCKVNQGLPELQLFWLI